MKIKKLVNHGMVWWRFSDPQEALGSDGNLWRTYPDNDTRDVTPKVDGVDYFTFAEPTPTKYHLYINLSTGTTNANLDIDSPTACVGQLVNFVPTWTPSAPPVAQTVSLWTLPTKYVNESWQGGHADPINGWINGSVNYDVNTALLTDPTTSCWFINGTGGSVHLGQNLTFENGQQVSVVASGAIVVNRPSVSMVNPALNGPPQNVWHNIWDAADYGEIGLGLSRGANEMNYLLQVKSQIFDGYGQIVQLCTLNATPTYYADGYLDGVYPYFGPNYITATSTPLRNQHSLNLEDCPQNGYVYSFSASFSYVDYAMFNPSTSSGDIFVTLGTLTWGTSFGAKSPSVAIDPNVVVPLTGPDSSDLFPEWNYTFY